MYNEYKSESKDSNAEAALSEDTDDSVFAGLKFCIFFEIHNFWIYSGHSSLWERLRGVFVKTKPFTGTASRYCVFKLYCLMEMTSHLEA